MDTVNHALTGFLTTAIPTTLLGISFPIIISIGIIGAILGAFPDIIGEYYAHCKKDGYAMYASFHTGEISKKIKKYFIYPTMLHIWLDKKCHGVGERWYAGIWYEYFMPWRWREWMWLEMLMWLINLILLYLFIYLTK